MIHEASYATRDGMAVGFPKHRVSATIRDLTWSMEAAPTTRWDGRRKAPHVVGLTKFSVSLYLGDLEIPVVTTSVDAALGEPSSRCADWYAKTGRGALSNWIEERTREIGLLPPEVATLLASTLAASDAMVNVLHRAQRGGGTE